MVIQAAVTGTHQEENKANWDRRFQNSIQHHWIPQTCKCHHWFLKVLHHALRETRALNILDGKSDDKPLYKEITEMFLPDKTTEASTRSTMSRWWTKPSNNQYWRLTEQDTNTRWMDKRVDWYLLGYWECLHLNVSTNRSCSALQLTINQTQYEICLLHTNI